MKKISYLKIKIFATISYIVLLFVAAKLGFSCIFRICFGIECPGCGMTRAFRALTEFDIVSAFKYHPMFWSIPIVYIYILFDHPVITKKIDHWVLVIVLIGFIINWLFRII